MKDWIGGRTGEYHRWFAESMSSTRELWNDFLCNENLLKIFGRRTIIDIPYLQREHDWGSPDTLLMYPWDLTKTIAWGVKRGLVSADWERYRFRLLDRRQQFVEIGPMANRGAVRVINPTLPARELGKLLHREQKRQDLADRRAMARNEHIAKGWLDWAMKVHPEALLPDELAEFAVEGIPFLRSYREVLLTAAGSRLDHRIGETLAEICLGPDKEPETPAVTVSAEDADAIDSLF